MSLFEFLMIMISIIVGLGIGEILTGVARLIRSRSDTQPYWVHSILVAAIFVALLQQWWEAWDVRDIAVWTFTGVLLKISGPVGLFLISHLLFPEPVRGANIREYYYGEMRPVWIIAVITVILATAFWPIVMGAELFKADNATSFIGLLAFVVLAVSKQQKIHSIIIPLFLVLILWDVLQWTFVASAQ